MACKEQEILWKECATDDFRDSWKRKNGLWPSAVRYKHKNEQLWQDCGYSVSTDVQEESRRNRFKSCEWVNKGEEQLDQEFGDPAALFELIRDCAKKKNLRKGRRVRDYLLSSELFKKDIYLANALVNMFAKCGAFAEAEEVFDAIPWRNIVSWNALISGYAQPGVADEALKCFWRLQEEGLLPNEVTFISILKACGIVGAADKGEQVHAKVFSQGLLEKDIVLGTAVVDMYAKCGALAKAQDVFDGLPARNVVTWTAIIAGYTQHGLVEEALKYFTSMREDGLSPNTVTYSCILKACGNIGAAEKGEEIHSEVLRQGLLAKDAELGIALVEMYMKCGTFAKAQVVFDELPSHNTVMWNVLITGYVQWGLGQAALSCYRQMQDECISPNSATFISILKACSSIQAVEVGEEIHAEARVQGLLEEDVLLGTAVVDMYAKCGVLENAQEAFNELPARDVVTYNVLISGYAQEGLGDEALRCFERMQNESLSPNSVTFVCLLKACGSIRAVETGQKIHAEVGRLGLLEKDMVLGNALVDMYARCGALAKAQEVFNVLPAWNIVRWNALIGGYAQYGYGDEALSCFEQMQKEDFSPNVVTYVCALKACGSTGATKKGEEIHAEVSAQGLLEENIVLGTALVDMYAKCGLVAKARGVFDELPAWDVVAWNALLAAYADQGLCHEALNCFERMQKEGCSCNAATFISILKACGSTGAVEKGEEICAEIRLRGLLEKDMELGNALVDMYVKCSMLTKAQEVFEKLPARDLVSWNTLIAGYSQLNQGEEALRCFKQMQEQGLYPNEVAYICMLKACGSTGAIKKGEEIHAKVAAQGLLGKYVMLGNTLVDMYVRCGALAKAQKVFDELPLRDIVTWNALMAGYVNYQLGDEVLACFRSMQDESLTPDEVTLLCILQACSIVGATKLGEEMHVELGNRGLLEKDTVLGNALLDMYMKCGAFKKAQEVFHKLPSRNVIAWTALISGYSQAGEVKRFTDLLGTMIREGIELDVVIFLVLLTGCSHAGLVVEGQSWFLTMATIYGIVPTLEHYTCMVDLYSRAGCFDTALSLIGMVPPSDRLLLWLALIGACQNLANVELGKYAFGHALELDDKFVPAYVCMSNMYAAAGLQEEAEEVGALNLGDDRKWLVY